MNVKDYEGGSEPIKVSEFRDKMQQLASPFSNPYLASLRMATASNRQTAIPEDLRPSSEFFRDATLFSLLREYRHSQGSQRRSFHKKRPKSKNDDSDDTDTNSEEIARKSSVRKSQAKDVMPGRLLHEEDESGDISNPHVPKKRQYLSSNRTPAIILNAKKMKGQTQEKSDRVNNEQMDEAEASQPNKTIESTSDQRNEIISMSPMNIEVESDSSSRTMLALPPTFSKPVIHSNPVSLSANEDEEGVNEISDDSDEDESEESQADEEDEDDSDAEHTANVAPPDNPRIAKTSLETRYLEMAKRLDNSKLSTLSPQNRIRVTRAQALPDNFLLPDDGSSFKKPAPHGKYARVKDGDVVLAVSIYQEKHPTRILQEFNVLGSQSLASLRDAITCGSDLWMDSEKARTGRKERKITATELHRLRGLKKQHPSFFFINGCFYSDARNKKLKDRVDDPCDAIIDWVNENDRYKQDGLGKFTKDEMQTAKFEDLEIQLNYPYLYCHQDVCKHILVFKDLCLAT
ncbi:small nuclear RNA activating complex, polypeptide 3 [Umbelopsis sp. WA50703]